MEYIPRPDSLPGTIGVSAPKRPEVAPPVASTPAVTPNDDRFVIQVNQLETIKAQIPTMIRNLSNLSLKYVSEGVQVGEVINTLRLVQDIMKR